VYLLSATFKKPFVKTAVTIPCFMAGTRLMKVKTWNISQVENKYVTRNDSYSHPEGMSPRSGPISQTAEIHWQVHTRVINLESFQGKLDQLFHFVNLILGC
jgi:hypothetical protein